MVHEHAGSKGDASLPSAWEIAEACEQRKPLSWDQRAESLRWLSNPPETVTGWSSPWVHDRQLSPWSARTRWGEVAETRVWSVQPGPGRRGVLLQRLVDPLSVTATDGQTRGHGGVYWTTVRAICTMRSA